MLQFSLIQVPILQWIPKALLLSPSPQRPSLTQLAKDSIKENVRKFILSTPYCSHQYQQEKVQVQLSSTEGTIRDVITELLSQCNIPYYQTPYDRDLHDLCIQECRLKGYPIDKIHGKSSIAKHIPSGVIMASTAYAHLKSRSTQVFIAIYTAHVAWIDDTYTQDVIGVDSFNERLVTGQKQANAGLDGFERLLRETHLHYHSIQANVILTSSLNYVTSIIIDFETQGIPVSFYIDGLE